MDSGVFYDCSNLFDIFCEAVEIPETEDNTFDEWRFRTAILYVPEESIEAYSTTAPWSSFRKIVPLGTVPPADEVAINATNFPDENFRNYLLSQDYGADGILTRIEASNILRLDISNKGIQNLKGLEYFFALEYLYIYQNSIKGEAMDALIEALPVDKEGDGWFWVMYNTGEQNEMTAAQVAAAKAKGWMPKEYSGSNWEEYDPSKNVDINETNFPDENFRSYLLSQTYGADGVLTANEISKINTINVASKGIKRLKGIEFFTAMRYLYCYNNQIEGAAMDELIECLPSSSSGYSCYIYVINKTNEQNVMTTTQVATAKAKGWTPKYDAGADGWKDYEGSEPVAVVAEINETNFPDANFRSWLLEQDYGSDGVLTNTEIAGITDINVFMKDIANLEGIGYFKELRKLRCDQNRLTSLDVSECKKLYDLICNSNQLTSLNVTGCTELQSLYCYSNRLTTLDVSRCSKLSFVQCYRNNIRGTAMDAFIESLPTVAYSYSLNVIDDVYDQNVMTTTQVAAAKAKGWIPKSYKNYSWEEYEGSEPVVGTEINEKNFPDANFRSWILAQSYGKDGILTEEEIASVTSIIVSGKSIQSLQGIEFFTALTILNCYNNQLSSLDVSKNTSLTTLTCNSNELTSIKVSNTALNNLLIYCNKIKDAAMDALVESLPTVSSGNMYVIYDWNEQNEMTTTQVAAAKAKGWMPKYMGYDSASGRYTWLDYAGSEPAVNIEINATNFPDENFRNYLLEQSYGADGIITSDEIEGITYINVFEKDIESLEGIGYFKNLRYLYCDNNKLTSLDLSNNTALESIQCPNNQLTSLDVSGCNNLQTLLCEQNNLTSLNISGCSGLYWLYIYQNQIKGAAMDALVESLPTVNNGQMRVIYNEGEGNVMTAAHVAAVKAKGWVPAYCTGKAYNEQYDYYYDVWKEIPDAPLRGDFNGDGKVGMPDLMFLLQKVHNGKFPDEE